MTASPHTTRVVLDVEKGRFYYVMEALHNLGGVARIHYDSDQMLKKPKDAPEVQEVPALPPPKLRKKRGLFGPDTVIVLHMQKAARAFTRGELMEMLVSKHYRPTTISAALTRAANLKLIKSKGKGSGTYELTEKGRKLKNPETEAPNNPEE